MTYAIKSATGKAFYDAEGAWSGSREARHFETVADAVEEIGKWAGEIVDVEIDEDHADVAYISGNAMSVYVIVRAVITNPA